MQKRHTAVAKRPAVTPSRPTALKFDSAKPPISLVPRSLIEAAARAFAFGAAKYARHNYRLGMNVSRLLDATLRHLLAVAESDDRDPESGLDHLDHAAASLGMLIDTLTRVRKGFLPGSLDDRWSEPNGEVTRVAKRSIGKARGAHRGSIRKSGRLTRKRRQSRK